MKTLSKLVIALSCVVLALGMRLAGATQTVQIDAGLVEGVTLQSGIHLFRGIPFAAPPVGTLRWLEPQPVKPWTGTRRADQFGANCMQGRPYGDMGFRTPGMSEDCLYLNVWTPATTQSANLPVLVYIFGGGFRAGDGSEPRYDGENMARQGIVAVTINYRLGVFGFLSHPELTRESPHKASGNYGLLDQHAALQWVHRNIAAFGGNPSRVTIAGESAGSSSVSAQMASPLSRNLIAGAIGESGAMFANRNPRASSLRDTERAGQQFAESSGAASLADLRNMPATPLLEASMRPDAVPIGPNVDGYFLTASPASTFARGEQAHVPLLAGWNSEERSAQTMLGAAPTAENLAAYVRKAYGANADAILKAYPVSNDDVWAAATALAGDEFTAFTTWKWIQTQSKTGRAPVYRYFYSHPRPRLTARMGNAVPGTAGGIITGPAVATSSPAIRRGAGHSVEIEYAMGNLERLSRIFSWAPEDHAVSRTMFGFFSNFVKTGDPNGAGLPKWPAVNSNGPHAVMHIDVESKAEVDEGARYALLDRIFRND